MIPNYEQPTQYGLPMEPAIPSVPYPSYGLPEPPLPPHKPSSKRRWLFTILAVLSLLFAGVGLYLLGYAAGRSEVVSKNTASPTPTQQATTLPSPMPSPTQTPTPPQINPPTDKSAYLSTTVGNLDKLGNQGKGKFYHFKARITGFVRDEQGNTGGANVSGIDTDYSIIQVIFPYATDLTKLNKEDTIEVWGYDDGLFSGTNAYGATVHEVAVLAVYLTDTTTGYSE